jgi:hypothetical protein
MVAGVAVKSQAVAVTPVVAIVAAAALVEEVEAVAVGQTPICRPAYLICWLVCWPDCPR